MEDNVCELVSLCEVRSSSISSVSINISDMLSSGVREASHDSSHPIPHSPQADLNFFQVYKMYSCPMTAVTNYHKLTA